MKSKPWPSAWRAGLEDVLVLLLGDELPFRVAGDEDQVLRAGQQRCQQVRRVEQRGEQRAGVFRVGDRADRLQAAGGDLLEGGVGGGVALHERVVVAEGDVGGDVEPARRERLLRPVHQARVFGPGGVRAGRAVGVVELGEGALEVVVVVLDAGVAGGLGGAGDEQVRAEQVRVGRFVDAAVGVERAALEQGPHPERLVELLAVGRVAGVDREVHRAVRAAAVGDRAGRGELVDLADHRLVDLRLERLPGPPGGAEGEVERGRERVDDLDPGRRLLVGELEVGELAEVDERGAGLRRGRRRRVRQFLAHRVGLAGAELEEAVGAGRGRDDPLFERRSALRCRRPRRRRCGRAIADQPQGPPQDDRTWTIAARRIVSPVPLKIRLA